jgi:hypothetical protein
MEPQPDGTIHMHQSGLIKKIIAAAKMEDANPFWTPAPMAALGSDPEGPAFDNQPWRYSSIVGMLIYICTNTRLDVSFTVSQVAKYSKEPKQSHATAVKTIIRYLKQTPEKGMYIKFTGRLDLLDYVNADFAGQFRHEQDPRNPNSARSRCGYMILLGGVPLFWKSALMTAICLSTLESEYQALRLSLKQVIGFRLLIQEIVEFYGLDDLRSTIHTRVLEGNQGALFLATNQRLTNRTKYFHTKWHHFWSVVTGDPEESHGPDGKILVEKVDTTKQGADYLTKSLPREVFENNRHLIQGW